MASLRNGKQRKDGTRYVQVLYRMDGKQTSTSFQDLASATRFKELVEKFGPEQALSTLGTDPDMTSVTVREWIEHHIEHLTGLRKSTLWDYQSYLRKDIGPVLGGLLYWKFGSEAPYFAGAVFLLLPIVLAFGLPAPTDAPGEARTAS